jgi:hypothetical protein
LAELPADRRAAIEAVRKAILASLDGGYEEGMQYGMIGYYVPHRIYPSGYHCDPKQPLPFAALASQKNYMSLYLGCVYGDDGRAERFQKEWAKTGKKLDMGKACIRFKRVEDLALDVIADAIGRVPADKFVAYYESVIQTMRKRPAKKAVTKAATKPAAKRVTKSTAAKKSVARATAKMAAKGRAKTSVKKKAVKKAVKGK